MINRQSNQANKERKCDSHEIIKKWLEIMKNENGENIMKILMNKQWRNEASNKESNGENKSMAKMA